MDLQLRDTFIRLFATYFGQVELPITLYYADQSPLPPLPAAKGRSCLIAQLARVRKGQDLSLAAESVGCFGGRRYMGFTDAGHARLRALPLLRHPRQDGRRAVQEDAPDRAGGLRQGRRPSRPPARYAIFKRWDRLEPGDVPGVVIFFAPPDVLSGLFTLAGFDETRSTRSSPPSAPAARPSSSTPTFRAGRTTTRAVLGMFDVSARPFVEANVLTFAVPMAKFERMVGNMDESFLITESWTKVKRRIQSAQ